MHIDITTAIHQIEESDEIIAGPPMSDSVAFHAELWSMVDSLELDKINSL